MSIGGEGNCPSGECPIKECPRGNAQGDVLQSLAHRHRRLVLSCLSINCCKLVRPVASLVITGSRFHQILNLFRVRKLEFSVVV